MPYEKWKAWGTSHALVLAIYKETEKWPSREMYGLVSQARRAAASAPLNLAEGSCRLGGRELRRFADIARGSLGELAYILRLALDLGYLSSDDWARLHELRDESSKLIYGLVRSIGRRAPPI